MTRNTERRIEVAAPILDKALADRVCESFSVMLRDNVKARELFSDGVYRRVNGGDVPLNSQMYFYKRAYDAMAAAEDHAESERRAVKAAVKNAPIKVKIRKIGR